MPADNTDQTAIVALEGSSVEEPSAFESIAPMPLDEPTYLFLNARKKYSHLRSLNRLRVFLDHSDQAPITLNESHIN